MRAIIEKEISEWLRGGSFGKWGRYELLIILLVGFVEPVLMGRQHHALMTVAVFVASIFSIGALADSFAGEKERRTLDTLFCLPFSNADIFIGKWIAGVLYTLTVGLGIMAAGTVSVTVARFPAYSLTEYAIGVYALFLVATLLSAVESSISLRCDSVRQAMQALQLLVIAALMAFAVIPNRVVGEVTAYATNLLANPSLAASLLFLLCAGCTGTALWIGYQKITSMRQLQ